MISKEELKMFNLFLSYIRHKHIRRILPACNEDDIRETFKIIFKVYHDLEKTINLMED